MEGKGAGQDKGKYDHGSRYRPPLFILQIPPPTSLYKELQKAHAKASVQLAVLSLARSIVDLTWTVSVMFSDASGTGLPPPNKLEMVFPSSAQKGEIGQTLNR